MYRFLKRYMIRPKRKKEGRKERQKRKNKRPKDRKQDIKTYFLRLEGLKVEFQKIKTLTNFDQKIDFFFLVLFQKIESFTSLIRKSKDSVRPSVRLSV